MNLCRGTGCTRAVSSRPGANRLCMACRATPCATSDCTRTVEPGARLYCPLHAVPPRSGRMRLDDVDEIAVELACRWERAGQLNRGERLEVVRRLTGWGYSAAVIAERAGCTSRTVQRDRVALGISQPVSEWQKAGGARNIVEVLTREGVPTGEIVRTTGVDERTVRKHRRAAGLASPPYVNHRYLKEPAA